MKKTRVLKDMAMGSMAEERVVKLLCSLGYNAAINQDKSKRSLYDIIIHDNNNNLLFTVEVKYDIYANKSGNIAIETFNPKTAKPSGIGITQATLWCHITDRIYIANTDALKYYVFSTAPKRVIASGGDDNATLYLYDHKQIVDNVFSELDECNPILAQSVIKRLLNGV